MDVYPAKRDLDGIYFRVKRDGRWQNACFTDMTETEQDAVLDGRTDEWLRGMCKTLARQFRQMGDELDVRAEMEA